MPMRMVSRSIEATPTIAMNGSNSITLTEAINHCRQMVTSPFSDGLTTIACRSSETVTLTVDGGYFSASIYRPIETWLNATKIPLLYNKYAHVGKLWRWYQF